MTTARCGSRGERVEDLLAVIEGLDAEHPVGVDPGHGRADRGRAGGDQQLVVAVLGLLAGVEVADGDGPRVGVDADHLVAGPHVDVLLLPEDLGARATSAIALVDQVPAIQ
jgi:hypothetical protein